MRPAWRSDVRSPATRRLAGAAFCFLLLSPALAGAAVLTPAEYAGRLDRAAQGMERAARTRDSDSQLADKAFAEVPARAEVRVSPGASTLPVDNRDLLAELRRDAKRGPAGMEEAARTLRSLQAGVAGTAPAPPDGRAALTRVLARREFHKSWWQRTREKLAALGGRAVRYVFEHFPSPPEGMHVPANLWRVIGYSALAAAALVVALLVVRMVMRLTGAPLPEERAAALGEEEPRRPHTEWLAEADRMLREGRYGAAVRAFYLAALMRLDETGRLSYDRARADGRFVRALERGGEAELARQLLELSRLFSRIWYGLAPADMQEYVQARQMWRRLEAMTAP
jgi:hypothetical protein